MKEADQSGGELDNGDLTDPKTVEHFGGNFKDDKAMLVTADGGINWKDENIQEQEAMILIFSQLCTAIGIQAHGGHFVIKFFETFTPLSLKFISVLRECYKTVYLVKPLTSRESNSEKYAVCIDFTLKEKEAKSMYKKLLSILKEAHERKEKKSYINQMHDIFPDYKIDPVFETYMIAINTQISRYQIIAINKIMSYIEENNYYGEEYNRYQQEQVRANIYWINTYFYDEKDPKNMQRLLETQKKLVILDSDTRVKNFMRFRKNETKSSSK